MKMHTLHFISHTHWDREWHEPFQTFRIRLARTIDKTLDILASDPDYKYFMLDGQTIVLEDYDEIQHGRVAELREHIKTGRVLIGPWYILPDEFLVSGESIIRNLQRGIRIAKEFGNCMMIGYIPDPFGHISQMPQILEGFGIKHAMFRRGLADERTELVWEGADGTRVMTTYLRDGYDNAAWLSRVPEQFAQGVKRLVASLSPYAVTEHMLMMHGTDHMQPWENLPQVMREAEEQIPEVRIIHSNLPDYARMVEESLASGGQEELIIVKGELRNPKRHHLLPGVTSTRMWIKQRNHSAQTLLERWAEPLAAVEMNLSRSETGEFQDRRRELRLAWKYLLQNHPHDSICGCSVDQVHLEMAPRFDWVEQVGENVVNGSLKAILHAIDTGPKAGSGIPIVVFNPTQGPRDDVVRALVDIPPGMHHLQILDEGGIAAPMVELERRIDQYAQVTATPDDLRWMFGAMKSGMVDGHNLFEMTFNLKDGEVFLQVVVSDQGAADPTRFAAKLAELDRYVADPKLKIFHVQVRSPERVQVAFFARDLPGYGYKTYRLSNDTDRVTSRGDYSAKLNLIENEFFRIKPDPNDGSLTITDLRTDTVFEGVNRFTDEGDCGDLYNNCPPAQDRLVDTPSTPPTIELVESNSLRRVLRISSTLQVPASLSADRASRSPDLVDLPIQTEIALYSGARRIDFRTQVDNRARDHRLRVEFPTLIRADQSRAAQAFDLVTREIIQPTASPDWVEKPVPTKPMQGYVAIDDGKVGLVVASRGLPEYEVKRLVHDEAGEKPRQSGSSIALTLLRCTGWLSRPDLTCRRGDAGPEQQTPGAQELGTHTFEYSFIPFTPEVSDKGSKETGKMQATGFWAAVADALAFNAPLRAVPTDEHKGFIKSKASWVEISSAEFMVTAIKPPEEGSGLIVRGFNMGDETISVRFKPLFAFSVAKRVNLNEEAPIDLAWSPSHSIEIAVKPREIVTLRFET